MYRFRCKYWLPHLVSREIGSEMLGADALEVFDVVLVSSSQQEIALVSQILEPAAVDKLHHVSDRAEVDVLDVDLVALALPHIVLKHGAEDSGTGAQDGLTIIVKNI